ncbi:monooxygenase [Mycolicibacterium litorale]|uniref:Monooxygenase n=2 Tax=Mycolicibacterium litorale TaxID=758802 RepID=A0A6S6PCQ6_9MYCO|nr:monooxygenase [Mycolicibacterium litorale]
MTTSSRNTAGGTDSDPLTDVDVVIVGAGFSGVGMGVQLSRQTGYSYVILERADDVGGSWRDNTYPGVACDVASHLYSYSFALNPNWSRQFSPGREILDYIRRVAADEGVDAHVRFGAEMLDARWNTRDHRWTVSTPRGEFTGRYLVAATGHLTDPKLPAINGIDDFDGVIMHSARWDHEVDLAGRRVGVVGSGASAVQIVPAIAPEVAQLVVFQRTPAYVVPRRDRAFSEAERRQFARDIGSAEDLRRTVFWGGDYQFAARRRVPQYYAEAHANALNHLNAQVSDPELRRKLTPNYDIGCKRILKSDDFYPALQLPNVILEDSALHSVAGGSAISARGANYDLDVLIFATGFETWDLPSSHRIFGRDGQSLGEQWSSGMQAFNSVTVHNFPNLFMVNGPATSLNHNSIIFMIETQISYVLSAIAWADGSQEGVVEVSAEHEQAYADHLHENAEHTAQLAGGCTSWYVDPRNGKATLSWPNFAHTYRDDCAEFDPAPYLERAGADAGVRR